MNQRWAWVAVVVAAVVVTQWASSAEPPAGSRRVVEYTARCVVYKADKEKCADISPSVAKHDCSAAADPFACVMEFHQAMGRDGWSVFPKVSGVGSWSSASAPSLGPVPGYVAFPQDLFYYERVTVTAGAP